MVIRNIKTFLKHLARNKVYTGIIIGGFSISLMFVILLTVYIKKEYSYDQFHVNKERVYRLVHENYSGFACPTGQLLVDTYPEVEGYTRIYKQEGYAIGKKDEKFGIDYLMADSLFYNMFTFRLIEGTPKTVLKENNSIVLSRSYALKLFGEIPEMGRTLSIDNSFDYKISGIMEDFPENTHFQKVDAIVDFPSLAKKWSYPSLLTNYDNNSFGLYLMAAKNTNLQSKAPEMLKLFKEVNWMFKRGYAKEVVVESLPEVYFGTSYSPGIRQTSKSFIKVLSGIVVLILLLSVFNYVNLTIALSTFRSKEIAIKKIMGGRKSLFILQYINESIALCIVSFLIALLFSFMAEPLFNNLMDTKLEMATAFNPASITFYVFVVIVTGIISGLIPALKTSGFNPVDVVKGELRMKENSIYSRALISFQYFLIIALIISAIFISKQTNYLRTYNLGYEKDNILSIKNTLKGSQSGTFKSILENIPGVNHVCIVRGSPVDGGNNNSFEYEGKSLSFQTFRVDTSFFRMMGMEVKHTGVALSDDVIWLNEAAVKAMVLPHNVTSVKIYGREMPVYGIVKDFHFRNLKQKIGPAYFQKMDADEGGWSTLVKISGKNQIATANKIREEYHNFTNGLPLNMRFIDETINQWYEREEKTGKIVKYLTLLTIIISVMGLIAMSLFYIQQKVKEIGIRKVNGAKVSEILEMINKEFIVWVVVAFILATPVAYYGINKWLESFAYKTDLSWWIFALAGLLALGIAILTVSWQSWRAATRNPVEALRYE
jgi:putative ABC transport system permease protein